MFVRALLILSLVGLIFSCSKEQLAVEDTAEQKATVESPDKGTFVVKLNESVQANDLTIEFMQLTGDSRCAKGVQCSWAGNAQVVLLVAGNSSAETVTLNTHGGDKYPQSAVINGLEIKLLGVSPYPATNIKIDPSQYMAQFSLTKAKIAQFPVIIDVRSEREFKLGHYPKALNINYQYIEEQIHSQNLPKDTKIYVYCRSGKRAEIAKNLLAEQGYNNVINGVNQLELHKTLGTLPKM